MKEQSFIEKRKNYRLPFDAKVIYTDGKMSRTAYAANISRGGLFLLSLDGPPINSEVHVSFLLPYTEGSLCMKARVAHIVYDKQRAEIECGMGVEFQEITKSQQAQLNLYVLNSRTNYLALQKALKPERPNMQEIDHLLKNLPKINRDLLFLRYRINRICTLFEENVYAIDPNEEVKETLRFG